MINTTGLHGHPKYFELLETLYTTYDQVSYDPFDAYDSLIDAFGWACSAYRRRLCDVAGYWVDVAAAGLGYLTCISGNHDVVEILQDMAQLHNDKNAGYAGSSNDNPLANFYACKKYLGIGPFEGCIVRLCDKYERIRHLREDPNNNKVNESIVETTNDLIAYSLIASILYLENGYA